jgi:acetyl esterase
MALNPQAALLLAQLAEAQAPSAEQVPLTVARDVVAGLRELQGEPEPVSEVLDILVPGPAGRLPVRIYRPVPDARGCPLIVYFHGGGWVTGGLEIVDRPLRKLANATGAVVANTGYRLAPETQFPGPVEDAYAAVSALSARAGEFGADPAKLAVAGDSAGGNLAAAICLMARDRSGPAIGAQLLLYPVTAPAHDSPFGSYRDNADGYLLTRDAMLFYWDHYLADPSDASNPYAAPLHATDHSALPPALIITAEFDPLRDEGEAYGRKLLDAGVETRLIRYDGLIHAFFWLPGALDAFSRAVDDIRLELTKHFGTTGTKRRTHGDQRSPAVRARIGLEDRHDRAG